MRTPKQRRLLRAFKDGDEDFILNSPSNLKASLYDAGILIPTREQGSLGGWKLTDIGQHIVKKMRRTNGMSLKIEQRKLEYEAKSSKL